MKKTTLLLTLFFAGTVTTYCQTSDTEADAMIDLLGIQKKEAVARLVHVSEKDSVTFWKLFDEFQEENKKIAANRINLYERTAALYRDMNPERADSLANWYFTNRLSQEYKLESYYRKIKTATNATVAFQFYQAEVYLLTKMRAQIMEKIPTFGELQAMEKKD
ncbi:MAG: hypothetical protein ACHQNT_01845 [Bacteroidia bacterium]